MPIPVFRTLTPSLAQLALDPLQGVNCYLVDGETLIDAGGKLDGKRIVKALRGRVMAKHVLTHVHPDHQGGSHHVCTTLGLPYIVPEAERVQAEAGTFDGLSGPSRRARASARFFGGPGHSVDSTITGGDTIGTYTAIALPGHTPGQLGFWHEEERTLVCGDALRNISFASGREKLLLPPDYFTVDPAEARRSAQKILELEPTLIAFGHGRPLRGEQKIVARLEALLTG